MMQQIVLRSAVILSLLFCWGCENKTVANTDLKPPEAAAAFKGDGKVSPERQKEIHALMQKAVEENNARIKAAGKNPAAAPPVFPKTP